MMLRMNRAAPPFIAVLIGGLAGALVAGLARADDAGAAAPPAYNIDKSQIAGWKSPDDLQFFLHGSMTSEFIPERLLRAFILAFPDLFANGELSAFGVFPDPAGGDLPIGFTRRNVPHLGGLPSLGINCAACHAGTVTEERDPSEKGPSDKGAAAARVVLGRPSRLNIYAFSGSVAVALLRAVEPEKLKDFLVAYLRAGAGGEETVKLLEMEIEKQRGRLEEALKRNPFGSKGIAKGELHELRPADLELDEKRLRESPDLVPLVEAFLKLFHNMRTALHVPEVLPPPVPTLPGPGRTDAFGVLAASFFDFPTQLEAPVKFGIAWNLEGRPWVHWDGNNDQPLARNLGAALGLGAPLAGGGKLVDFAAVKRHTDLTEALRSPAYPWTVDPGAAARGEPHYRAHCARCHEAPQENRLYAIEELGTDPQRARFFDDQQAKLLNRWVADLKVPGYDAPAVSFRSTRKYWAADMAGVWARSPYLHNGSVRTLWDLLAAPTRRPKTFLVGTSQYDQRDLGYRDEGSFTFDTSRKGNSNLGHDYGTMLTEAEKRDLLEYLKTR